MCLGIFRADSDSATRVRARARRIDNALRELVLCLTPVVVWTPDRRRGTAGTDGLAVFRPGVGGFYRFARFAGE